MTVKLANNVSGFLNTAITASDTGIVLQSGNGASFPALGAGEYFYATLVSTGNTLEVVKVTARSGDSMTVVRAQDGTSAASFAAGSRLEIRVTVASVRDAISDVATASAIGFTPVGGISATNVQAAIAELDSEAAKSAVLAAAGGAALIGNTPAGTIAATTVQGAINEIVSDLAASSGASLVGFLQAGSGTVQRTVQSKLRDVVSVKDFGAVGDGVTDIGIALQAAHDALGPDGGAVLIPAASSYYLMSTGVSFTKPVQLVGDGWYASEILTNTNAITLISAYSKLDVQNLHFTALTAARGTCKFILHQPTSANHGHSTINNCYFDGAAYCYHSQSTNAIVLDGNIIAAQGAGGIGVWLENFVNPDTGDSFIINNTISGASTAIGIQVDSTSGINICNNKFNNELAHILVSAGANPMGNYLISNNSFEGHTDYAIKLIATSGTVTKTLITGNQFSATSTNHVVVSNGARDTVITGNTFNHTNAALGTGISIEVGSQNTTITGNAFHQIANAIVCAANATLGITMSGNRFASDVAQVFVGDDGQNIGTVGSNREISVTRYFQEGAGTLTDAFRFQGNGTLEIMVYGLAQGAGWVNWTRKVAVLQTTTVNDINAAVAQGSAISVALTAGGGFLDLQVARSAGTLFTGYVEVIARGQISYVRRM